MGTSAVGLKNKVTPEKILSSKIAANFPKIMPVKFEKSTDDAVRAVVAEQPCMRL